MKKNSPRNLCLALALGLTTVVFAAPKATQDEKDYRQGMTLYHAGHYEEALVRFQMAIDENWGFWQSYQMVGYCHFELREKEAALRAFEESLRINPKNEKLVKIYNDLKAGTLEVPVRPVEAAAQPAGTPVLIRTYYSYNK
jgi:tetratricopeptide (TPR) repeat protein